MRIKKQKHQGCFIQMTGLILFDVFLFVVYYY